MRLELEITTAADAVQAVAVVQAIAAAMGATIGEALAVAGTTGRRSRRADAPVTTAPAAENLTAAYNAIAEATGAAPIASEPAQVTPPAAEVQQQPVATAQPESPPAPMPFDRKAAEDFVKAGSIARGIMWVRENVFGPYKVQKVGELSDDQLKALQAKMEAENAAKAAA